MEMRKNDMRNLEILVSWIFECAFRPISMREGYTYKASKNRPINSPKYIRISSNYKNSIFYCIQHHSSYLPGHISKRRHLGSSIRRKLAEERAAAKFNRRRRMKTNGRGVAVDAFTYVSRDPRGVSSLNPHPSARENIARLMICPTGGQGGGGWRAHWRRELPRGNTDRRNSFATFHIAPFCAI